MLEQIHIKDVATFKDECISDLKKINFIYGANGSGKTTISKIIQSPDRYPNCELKWSNDSKLEAFVYNKIFKEKNLRETIPGVFTLGSDSVTAKEEIENKKNKLKKLDEYKNNLNGTKTKLEEKRDKTTENFQDVVWKNIKIKYENLFDIAFSGLRKSKDKFAQKVIDEYGKPSDENENIAYNLDDLKKRAVELSQSELSHIEPIPVPDIQSIVDFEDNKILDKKIIGKGDIGIAHLIKKLGISDWVNQGREYITENSDICPFCQKHTIDDNFKKQLEEYFDQTFKEDINSLNILANKYKIKIEEIQTTLSTIIKNEKENKNSKLDIQELTKLYKSLETTFATNMRIFDSKLKEPSRSFKLESAKELIDSILELFKEANAEIEKHNNLIANLKEEEKSLINDIWKYCVKENKGMIELFLKEKKECGKGIANIENSLTKNKNRIESLNAEIRSDTKNLTSIQPSIDEINSTLKSYGFTNFEIVEAEDNSYQIKRENGDLATDTLSEGEVTFITFLYFMQLIKGGNTPETATADRIVVIDDPISSLDSTILFVVTSLIRKEIEEVKKGNGNIKQILILTHNVYFHKEASFINARTTTDKNTYHWIVRKNNNESKIQCYECVNPIRGSYDLLWEVIRNRGNTPFITIQNTMRRIYEIYFKLLGRFKDDDILEKFDDIQDKEICHSLLSWINVGSHEITDDFNVVSDDDTTERYLDVFKRIFEVMGHLEHYKMMMRIETDE